MPPILDNAGSGDPWRMTLIVLCVLVAIAALIRARRDESTGNRQTSVSFLVLALLSLAAAAYQFSIVASLSPQMVAMLSFLQLGLALVFAVAVWLAARATRSTGTRDH